MKPAPALVLASLFLVTGARAASADAGAPTLAAAQKGLEAARASLEQAVKRIEADPPSTPDLDAAHAAVGLLKDAIDAGAAFEQADLEYAKAALAARKELRAQREYVDQRRAKVHIHEHRRVIDAALATLKDAAKKLEEKEPAAKDFDDARAAGQALKAALDASRPFGSQDQAFATYLAQADATLARQGKAIDDRWILLSADKHRVKVEESRQALTAAMAPLGKGATDAQFEAADKALGALGKLLEEGKILEAGEKTYRAVAERARAESVAAKKKMDELWTATGLARLKAEIEPAYKDLQAAARIVRGRKPTPEQLAEARTVAIIVGKLVEKFQPEAARSAAFGEYVVQVKNTLVEVEVQLQLRGLGAAQADFRKALAAVERKNPTDEQFDEGASALLVLEKTLATVHAKDPVMAAPAADAFAWIREGKATLARRRIEVDVERQRAKVEEARKQAAGSITQVNQVNAGEDRLLEAENAVNQIRLVLEAGAGLIKKDREYAAYDREVKQRMAEMTAAIAARRVANAATEGKAQLAEGLATTKAKLDAAKQPAATDADVEAASRSVDAYGQGIEARVELEKKDKGYAAQADKARYELVRQQEALEFARQARDLRKKTGEALAAGAAAADAAAASSDLRVQKTQYEKALGHFKACKDEGPGLVEGNRALAGIVVLVEGRNSTPKDTIAQCTQRADATALLIKPLVALIAFDEGPKRAFEKAKALMSQGKKTDALAQFDECTATGMTLQYRNPELKDRKFDVGGGSMSLLELNRECSAQSKALRGK